MRKSCKKQSQRDREEAFDKSLNSVSKGSKKVRRNNNHDEEDSYDFDSSVRIKGFKKS